MKTIKYEDWTHPEGSENWIRYVKDGQSSIDYIVLMVSYNGKSSQHPVAWSPHFFGITYDLGIKCKEIFNFDWFSNHPNEDEAKDMLDSMISFVNNVK